MATCPQCGEDQTIASWVERPAPIHTVRSSLDRPDLYRRAVSGVVANAVGIPWLRQGAAAAMTFGPENVDLAATALHGGREIEGIDYVDIDHLVLAAVGSTVESIDTVVTLRAGHRELSLRTSAFDAGTLERLLDPVQIRIDTARRAPRVAPPPPIPPVSEPTWFAAPPTPVYPTTPYLPPVPAPPPSAPPWRLIGAGAVILLAVIALTAWIAGGSSSTDTSATRSSNSAGTGGSQGGAGSAGSANSAASQASRTLATPVLVGGPDGSQRHESCSAGFDIPNASGWPRHSGRGTDKTSCQFALNVGTAYWQMGTPDTQPRRVVAQGAVDCQLGGDRCQGNLFVMNCQAEDNPDWITCKGGNNAVVYLFGE